MVIMRYAIEHIIAYGHKNIKASHKTTIEITRESWLTPRGDCIIGVNANKGPKHFNKEFKNIVQNNNSIIIAILIVNDVVDVVVGRGSSSLTLDDEVKVIFRKSEYTCPRTVMIRANKAAADIRRELIEILRSQAEKAMIHVFLLALTYT